MTSKVLTVTESRFSLILSSCALTRSSMPVNVSVNVFWMSELSEPTISK